MLDVRIGGYRIVELLAKGGMGEVYLARHEIMAREAAIKVLHPELSERPDLVERFLNEARAAASIRHPGIVEVFDVGYAGGRAYIIMEYLRGEMLAQRMARRRIPIDKSLILVRQVAGALGAAHACGIIHRDLKPENIFIIPDPDVLAGERTKVLDFGIAKLLESQLGVHTVQGSLFGTPAYMAPEQCEDAATVDRRADLYSLGCILYELLSGAPPFGRGGMELVAAHLRDEPRSLRAQVSEIPEDLEAIVMRLLAKVPEQRFETCEALTRALDHVRSTRPGSVGPSVVAESEAAAARRLSSLPLPAPSEAEERSSSAARNAATAPGVPHRPRLSRARAGMNAATSSAPVPRMSSTTHAGSGQVRVEVQARSRAEGRPRRMWLIAAALAATGALVAGAATQIFAPSRSNGRPAEEAANRDERVTTLLAEAHRAAGEQRWDDLLVHASRVIEVTDDRPDSEPAREARGMRELAREEQRNAYIYEKIQRAAGEGAVVAAIESYDELPPSSAYHPPASELVFELRESWLETRRERAEAYLEQRRCRLVTEVADEVQQVIPEVVAEFREIEGLCRKERRRGRVGGDDDDEKDAPRGEADEPEDEGEDVGARSQVMRRRIRRNIRRCVAVHEPAGDVAVRVEVDDRHRVVDLHVEHSDEGFQRCVEAVVPRRVAVPAGSYRLDVRFP